MIITILCHFEFKSSALSNTNIYLEIPICSQNKQLAILYNRKKRTFLICYIWKCIKINSSLMIKKLVVLFIKNFFLLLGIHSFILFKKSLFNISSHTFDSKRIQFAYPPTIFFWMFFFGRHNHVTQPFIIKRSAEIMNIYFTML